MVLAGRSVKMAQMDWILEVLSDLRGFADANGLQRLAAELDQTLAVAAADIARTRSAERRMDHAEEQRSERPTGPSLSGKSH
jgi:predicted transcriptional regulator